MPSPWVENYDETYCTASLKIVRMLKIQLEILVLVLSSGMVVDVFQLTTEKTIGTNVFIWLQYTLINVN